METSRRALLRRIGQSGALAAGVGTASAQNESAGNASAQNESAQNESAPDLRKTAVIPKVEEFAGNYRGQWLEVNDRTNVDASPVEDCRAAEWTPEETVPFTGYLMDRRGGRPPIIELTVLTRAGDEGPEADTTYIVDEVEDCGGEFVSLGLQVVPIRSVAAGEPGPEAGGGDGGDGGGGTDSVPGFGVGVATAALGTAAAARAIRRRFE